MEAPSAQARIPRHPLQTNVLHVPEALLRIQTVVAVTGLSESSIRRKVVEGKFPTPVRDGTRCTRWVAGSVSKWLRTQGEQATTPVATSSAERHLEAA